MAHVAIGFRRDQITHWAGAPSTSCPLNQVLQAFDLGSSLSTPNPPKWSDAVSRKIMPSAQIAITWYSTI